MKTKLTMKCRSDTWGKKNYFRYYTKIVDKYGQENKLSVFSCASESELKIRIKAV